MLDLLLSSIALDPREVNVPHMNTGNSTIRTSFATHDSIMSKHVSRVGVVFQT